MEGRGQEVGPGEQMGNRDSQSPTVVREQEEQEEKGRRSRRRRRRRRIRRRFVPER